jgi:hypothetical protein
MMPAELAYVAAAIPGQALVMRNLRYLAPAFVFLLLFLFMLFAFRNVHNCEQSGQEYIFRPKFLYKFMPFPLAALGVWAFLDTLAILWLRLVIGLGICGLAICGYPKVIRFDQSGISSKDWLGRPLQLPWGAITEVRRTSGTRYTSSGYDIRDSNEARIQVLDMVYDTESMIRILQSKVKIKVDDPNAPIQLEI